MITESKNTKANIARRVSVNDIKDIKPLLAEYARLYPEHLPHGVVDVLPAPSGATYFMATDSKGIFRINDVTINDFNSKRDLINGLKKTGNGQLLNRQEEYGLETLWHEILHNRQKYNGKILMLDDSNPVRILAESINQYVARKTYPNFIKRLGSRAQHQNWIKLNGYGYNEQVLRFNTLLDMLKLNNNKTASKIFTINLDSELLLLNSELSLYLSKGSDNLMENISGALLSIDNKNKFDFYLRKL